MMLYFDLIHNPGGSHCPKLGQGKNLDSSMYYGRQSGGRHTGRSEQKRGTAVSLRCYGEEDSAEDV